MLSLLGTRDTADLKNRSFCSKGCRTMKTAFSNMLGCSATVLIPAKGLFVSASGNNVQNFKKQ